jgi:antitoxin HigA-1
MDHIPAQHPGIMFKEDFADLYGLGVQDLARDLHVSPNSVESLLTGRADIDADMALRLSVFCRTTPEFWLNLQARYNLDRVRARKLPALRRVIRPFSAADRATT